MADDPAVEIDYSYLGSQIQRNYTEEELYEFSRKFWASEDDPMATLAVYARFLYKARREEATGNSKIAQSHLANAKRVLENDVLPQHRWR